MSTLASRLSSPSFVRKFSWLSGFVLLAGVIAFGVAYLGDRPEKVDVRASTVEPAAVKTPVSVPLDPQARKVAGEFVVTAVTRQDLKKAWALAHPDLRSAVTRQQWFNGEIPVPFYAAKSIQGASFKLETSQPNEVILDLLILPKKGAVEPPQAFFVTLKAVGKGKSKRWLVASFLPHGGRSTAVPYGTP
ncbi:MAG: hypothetical protein M3321_09040 [Actinomycetota bacterium]|nr:hypothetical protein [Actinomycetota bacterium]